MGVNVFTDLTAAEFKIRLGYSGTQTARPHQQRVVGSQTVARNAQPPDHFDWREKVGEAVVAYLLVVFLGGHQFLSLGTSFVPLYPLYLGCLDDPFVKV